jgi:hypothetical protein
MELARPIIANNKANIVYNNGRSRHGPKNPDRVHKMDSWKSQKITAKQTQKIFQLALMASTIQSE